MSFFRSRFLRSRPGVVMLSLALLLALFLIRPGAGGMRTRIARSVSLALGRQVDIGSVSLRLLPQPGFDLENFVVHDDPAFSAEPILRSQEVTAALRITSLLRGRLEIARLSLTEPSLNLVRNGEGRWNLEELLERTAKIAVAPTSKAKSEARPGFPYIEADRGRINLKIGQEKKRYALTNAGFSFWQDSENTWGMRLKAQPVRTDLNLTDNGLLKVNGTWQRASSLRETPLQFSLQWDGAQLGQVTKLASGNDKGWRGTVKLSASLRGTPGDLTVESEASVQDFRRYDLLGGEALRLEAQCSGHYSAVDRNLSNLSCRAPVGDGVVTVDGSIGSLPASRVYDLTVIARDVPMQSLARLASHAKSDMADDLVTVGKLDAEVKIRRAGPDEPVAWIGGGETLGFGIRSARTNTELNPDRIPFSVSVNAGTAQSPAEPRLDIAPFSLGLGRPTPASVAGWLSVSGYSFHIEGDAQVQRLLQVARTLGLRSPQPAANGTAKLDLQIAGDWRGFKPAIATGQAQLHSVRAELRGMNSPLEIASADLTLAVDEINVQNLTASLADSTWHGSLSTPRPCAAPESCPVRFNLHADQIATDQLSQILNPRSRKRPWYRFLSSSRPPGASYLAMLRASGKLSANRVEIHGLVGTHVSANVEVESGKLRLSDLRGDVLGGKHVGEWRADFTAKPPEYSGTGRLDRVALGQLAEAMRDGWITGTASATYRATASGFTVAELLASANATLQVDARGGTLPHITLASDNALLHVHHLVGRFVLRDGKFEIQEGKLETTSGIYQLSGTASLGRILDVKLMRDGGHGFNLTGSLTVPRVAPATSSETQAALKP